MPPPVYAMITAEEGTSDVNTHRRRPLPGYPELTESSSAVRGASMFEIGEM